jgi:hypothetical protein
MNMLTLMLSLFAVLLLLSVSGSEVQSDENDVYVITTAERSLEQINQIYSTIPPVKYSPPRDRWKNLPRTKEILRKGTGELKIVMLGDSIINDNSRSCWELLLQQQYPKCKITKVTCVRGSTGCWWYREPGRVQRYVLDFNPDLVIIGGISQRDDIESIHEVIDQIRASSEADILLLTGPFGTVDPNDEKQFQFKINPKGDDYRAKLMRLSKEMKTGFMDLCGYWGEYIKQSGHPVDWFKRDVVHADEKGEQVIGRLLAAHLGK